MNDVYFRVFIRPMIIVEISNAPTLRLKALNKHIRTHIMFIETVIKLANGCNMMYTSRRV